MAQDTNQNRPADVAQADSVGGMAKRLLNPAHLSDLARRSAATLKEQGAEQLWRDVTFRVGLAFHHDSWQHRADLPLRRELKAQRVEYADGKPGPVVSVVVPLYNTPEKFFGQMLASVQKQTYPHWQLVLVDASDAAHAAFSTHAKIQGPLCGPNYLISETPPHWHPGQSANARTAGRTAHARHQQPWTCR